MLFRSGDVHLVVDTSGETFTLVGADGKPLPHGLSSGNTLYYQNSNANQTAGRSLEIPASGTFLLAMRTKQHLDLFEEGKEAEFFQGHEELCAKARYYLEHEDRRREVARRGHLRCVRSDYSYSRYMRDDWAKLLEAFHTSRNTARSCPGSRAITVAMYARPSRSVTCGRAPLAIQW